jgi:hypothetical protein
MVANSAMSAPAENGPSPAPRISSTRTAIDASTAATTSGIACHMARLNALRREGRSMVSVATGPSIARRSSSDGA